MQMDPVQRQIELLRKKLLDLTRLNRMLNYRPSKRISLEIVGEESALLYRLLVEDGKRLSFVGVPDPPKRTGRPDDLFLFEDDVSLAEAQAAAREELDFYLGSDPITATKLDTKLNTTDYELFLQVKLRAMLREAKLAAEELGINTLFLTLGMLEWSEGDDRVWKSPLLFVPVQLEQTANGSIRLVHDGNDIGDNLPLSAKLAEQNLRLPEWDDEKGVPAFFEELAATIRGHGDWRIEKDAVTLGFFNYEKYAMYLDLGGEAWPDGKKPWHNVDLRAMLGEGYAPHESSISEDTFLDDVRPVEATHEVFDADASQTTALVRAAEGVSMVVEGPPGTGKSQTITNMIAEAVAAGKTVLFVAAKRAAVEVVHRRLTEADLGPMCLDLHDKMVNRREFYAELKRTVNRNINVKEQEQRVAHLATLRDQLNRHAKAVNEPVSNYGCTPFEAMAELAKLPPEGSEDREARVDFESIKGFKAEQLPELSLRIRAVQDRLAIVGLPTAHPFWGAEVDYFDPGVRLDLTGDSDAAHEALKVATSCWRQIMEILQIELAPGLANAEVLLRAAERAKNAPEHKGIEVQPEQWKQLEATARQAIRDLKVRREALRRISPLLRPEAYSVNVLGTESIFAQYRDSWYKPLVGSFRKARAEFRALLAVSRPVSDDEAHSVLRDLLAVQRTQAQLQELRANMERLFGAQWQGQDSDPEVIEKLLEWVLEFHASVSAGVTPLGLLSFFSANGSSVDINPLAEEAIQNGRTAIEAYSKAAKIVRHPTQDVERESWTDLEARVLAWRNNLARLPEYIQYRESRKQMVGCGLEPLGLIADTWQLAAERLDEAFRRSYYSGVVREAMQSRPELKSFDRAIHERNIGEFQSLDDFKLQYNRAQVRLRHERSLPTFDQAVGNLNLLRMQCELTRKHKPIRWAMKNAGEAVKRIKPVFMMSPLTVAVHLPPDLPQFDLVIFDEASQIRPEDALCAIARAKQCVVVGDTRQMPPSSFFDRISEDDSLEEEEGGEIGQEARKLESILSLMSAVVTGRARRPDLRWHYRSVHPSLIEPSNEMFYDHRLVVFPSPANQMGGERIGVVFHHDPNSVYESGSKYRVNRLEAAQIADRILDHVRNNPSESLLVAAMNKSQADLIEAEVARRQVQDPGAFAEFALRHSHEPLRVKNLENVQGDERDVVFVSVTYGRDRDGVVRQQFGPILLEGGERRLNVLFTRARKRCEIFSNITADDIRSDSSRIGLNALKRYLKFAQTGSMDVAGNTPGEVEESPFEEELTSSLRDRGYEVHSQVGSQGFRIEMAVVDPEDSSRYVLGIECDGAMYHSARTARDRDKLRQRVLENRGWRLHRIWSRDWWQDRDGEVVRVVRAIEEALSPVDAVSEPVTTPMPAVEIEESFGDRKTVLSKPYAAAEPPEPRLSGSALEEYGLAVVRTEGPIHRDLLFLRLKVAAGYESARGSTRSSLDHCVDRVVARSNVFQDAVYADAGQLWLARDWSGRPAAERKLDWVTVAEIASATMMAVGASFGLTEADAPRAVLRVLGFARATAAANQRVESVIANLIATGGIVRSDRGLKLPGQ